MQNFLNPPPSAFTNQICEHPRTSATAKGKGDESLKQPIYSSTSSMGNDLILTVCQEPCVRYLMGDRKHKKFSLRLLKNKLLNGTFVCSLSL